MTDWNGRLSPGFLRWWSSEKCVIFSEFPKVSLFNIMFWRAEGTIPDGKCKSAALPMLFDARVNHANQNAVLGIRRTGLVEVSGTYYFKIPTSESSAFFFQLQILKYRRGSGDWFSDGHTSIFAVMKKRVECEGGAASKNAGIYKCNTYFIRSRFINVL